MPGSAKRIIDAHLHGERVVDNSIDKLSRAEAFAVRLGAVGAQVLTVGGLVAAVVLLLAGMPAASIAAVIPAILGGAAQVVSATRGQR